MSLNPLNELKRRLDNNDTPLAKRLCLAKNVIQSHHFPSAPKERVVADWLQELTQKNKLSSEDIRNVIGWLNVAEDLTNDLKSKLIQIVSQYLQRNPLQNDDVPSILSFLENTKLTTQLSVHIDESLIISITLLQYLRAQDNIESVLFSQKVFRKIVSFYKETKKKLEFIIKLLDGENLETIFSYLESDRSTVISLCESIIFPMNKKSFFASYLQTLVRKDNIDDLIAEKGDNIQSVLKIMDTFFAFPRGRTCNDESFLSDLIDVFVSCFKGENQLIFAFYIMVANCLNMEQSYFNPAMEMARINFEENSEKVLRKLFLDMLDIIMKNEVDINIRLTDTLGVKLPKVETKKTFLLFLEAVMMGQLKLEGKPDKATFQIIKTALKLDPTLIEQRMDKILPPLMAAKKSINVLESYTEMLNCLLETLFKLSRGTTIIKQILPFVKSNLETSNTEQAVLKQKAKEAAGNGQDYEKIKSKIITGNDVFPEESIELYGKLTSELMFRQNKDLLITLQIDFENYCLNNLYEGKNEPSTATLAEVMSAILSTFLRHIKMADHTVPLHIAEDFWIAFKSFEMDCLKKFGECIVKQDDPQLTISFLKLCLSCSQLKLLNIKYSNNKLEIAQDLNSSELFDLSMLLPCLTAEQWIEVASKIENDEAVLLLDEILLVKTMVIQTFSTTSDESNEVISSTKSHLIKQLNKNTIEPNKYFNKVLFSNIEKNQLKLIAKTLVKIALNDNTDIIDNEAMKNNKPLLNALVVETVKNICKCIENAELFAKGLNKSGFDFISFAKETDVKEYFKQLSIKDENQNTLSNCVEILKHLQIYYLEEKYQLTALFVLLAIKNNSQKKIRRNVDYILQSVFELSSHPPDLYKIFPVNFIFSFKDKLLIDLLTLKIKTSYSFLVIKCLIESAVRRVKGEPEIVKGVVELLLTKQSKVTSSSIEFFSDPAFQISCLILPLIVKQKKAITTSAFRSILADLQERLHKSLLESFKNINFKEISNFNPNETGNTDDSVVVSDNTMATLNAISAYSLTLAKYCESTDSEEIKNLDYLWNALEFFVQNAILSIQNPLSKHQHIESSIQLLNSVLRYIKKLETHEMFQTKDKLYFQIWGSVKLRLSIVFDESSKKKYANNACLEDISVTLKFLCELVSVDGFVNNFVGDLNKLAPLENPSKIIKKEDHANTIISSHKVSKYLWTQILKANIVGPKCVALSKLLHQNSRNLKNYIHQHYENEQNGVIVKSKRKKLMVEFQNEEEDDIEIKVVKIDDTICEMLKIYLETLSEGILAAKKVNLDFKSLDSIFEVQHAVHYIVGRNAIRSRCEISWQAFIKLFEVSVSLLNSLLVSREELLEDSNYFSKDYSVEQVFVFLFWSGGASEDAKLLVWDQAFADVKMARNQVRGLNGSLWPCYMQCYRSLVWCLCDKSSSSVELERSVEEKLGELAHSIEKLTQSICKRKSHVSRIAAYTVADISSALERSVPSRNVRQHLENSIALLIQASDTTHAMAFLRRALAGSPGQMTMTNMYNTYKRYHKYVGNA